MKTYVLGTAGDRILTVKKSGGQYVVTIKRKDDDNKFVELPPKRLVGFLCIDQYLIRVFSLLVDYSCLRIPVSYTHLTLPTNREV